MSASRGRGVGHAQQRLGERHQRQTLARVERVIAQNLVEAARGAWGADRPDKLTRQSVDAGLAIRGEGRADKRAKRRCVLRSVGADHVDVVGRLVIF